MMRIVYFCLTSYEQNMTFYVKLQQIWAGPLSNNRVALVLLSRATVPHSITGNWDDIGIPENSVIEARDVWEVILIRLLFLMPLKIMTHFSFAFVFVRYLHYMCAYVFLAAQDTRDKICWKLDSQRGASQLQNVCVEANCLSSAAKCTLGIALFCIFFLLILIYT